MKRLLIALLFGFVAAAHGANLKWAAQNDILTLDPHSQNHATTNSILQHTYEGLTRYNKQYQPEPCLATSWEITNSGKTYTFKLRPNVKFHNGQPMTADDVKYSVERVLDPKTASPWISVVYVERSTCAKMYRDP